MSLVYAFNNNKKKPKHVFSIFSSLCIKSESKRHSLFLSKKALCLLLPVTAFAKNAATFECPRRKCVILSTFEYGGINILSVLWQSKCVSLSSADYGYRKRSTPQVWSDTRMSTANKGWRECAGHSWPVLCHPLVHRKGYSIKWIQVPKKINSRTREFRMGVIGSHSPEADIIKFSHMIYNLAIYLFPLITLVLWDITALCPFQEL